MTAKLIKVDDRYELLTQGFLKGSTNYELIDSLNVEEGNIRYKLSLKNCQAIERGYDLDELADEYANEYEGHIFGANNATPFKAGFQKALELMGDKKFSEENVIIIAEYIRVASQSSPSVRTKDLFNEYQSLQQTEWDVIIEMGAYHDGDFINDGKTHIIEVKLRPILDSDGCLILKRK